MKPIRLPTKEREWELEEVEQAGPANPERPCADCRHCRDLNTYSGRVVCRRFTANKEGIVVEVTRQFRIPTGECRRWRPSWDKTPKIVRRRRKR